jgi:hypothetical protein
MCNPRLRLAAAGLAMTVTGLALTSWTALAYPQPGGTGTLVAGCAVVEPGQVCTFQFKFVDGSGQAEAGEKVQFIVKSGGTVNPTEATTDAFGVTGTVFTAGTTCGPVTLTANTSDLSAQATITVCGPRPAGPGGTPAPQATTPPSSSNGGGFPSWAIVAAALAALLLIGGGAAMYMRRPAKPRI